MRETTIGRAKLQLVVGDITAQDTEAVVNAANERLAPGGGVAGAIARALEVGATALFTGPPAPTSGRSARSSGGAPPGRRR